jgi:hypothetical protein
MNEKEKILDQLKNNHQQCQNRVLARGWLLRQRSGEIELINSRNQFNSWGSPQVPHSGPVCAEQQKNYEKKVKMSQIKMLQILPQGELLQREERLWETFLWYYVGWSSPRLDYTERRTTKRNIPTQNSLVSASMKTSTERRKAKKHLFFVHKITKKIVLSLSTLFLLHKITKKFFLVFLLSVEVLPEADTKEFRLRHFPLFS